VDTEKRSIYLATTKGSVPRIVFFTKETADMIRAYIPSCKGEKLFAGLNNRALDNLIKKAVSLAFPLDEEKIKTVTPHTFRHSFATSWLQHDRHPIILKRIMGWKSMTMLNVYEHLQTEKLMQEYRQFEKRR
jgi:integrase/recombinase XerD